MRFLIGIDDTDNLESRGTGYRARQMGALLAERGLATIESVTRHQLLVDPRIPYTSHNSSACIAVSAPSDGVDAIVQCCRDYLLAECASGSDAGLCVGEAASVAESVRRFGQRAKVELLTMDEAEILAAENGFHLEGLTGTRGGIIGSLAAVGLHAFGTDGRFLWLPGLRELTGVHAVAELHRVAAIDEVRGLDGSRVDRLDTVDVGSWPRPVLLDGLAVLLVEENREDETRGQWRVAPKEVIKRY